jgi:uncharacterized membrane-anchored protein YhcB (DUF1043 family)
MSFVQRIGYKSWAQVRKVYAIIFSITIVTFAIRVWVLTQYGLPFHFNLYLVSVIGITFIWETLRIFNHYLNRVFPFEQNLFGRISIQIFWGVLMGFLMRTVIYFAWEPYLPFKLDSMFVAVTWFMFIILPAGINLGFFTAHFIEQWKEGILRTERLEKEKTRVQFDNLKNQLNPHFLFNALTSLNSLIREDPELASRFLQHMSKIYRYVLQHKDQSLVSVGTELGFIKNYVFLAETRFANALTITFNVSENHMERTIVPVTLQVLFENAFKHNIMDAEKPLHIEVYSEDEYLVICNNLQKKRTVDGSNKQGLENLKSLYRFLTDKPVTVEETSETFLVKIPLI